MGKLGWFRFIPHIQIYTLNIINSRMMEQYIARELKEDIKYLIQKVTELNNKQINNKMDNKEVNNKKNNRIKLFDNFDWAAIGVAAVGVVLFIHLVIQLKG